jgi:hypothetical protein
MADGCELRSHLVALLLEDRFDLAIGLEQLRQNRAARLPPRVVLGSKLTRKVFEQQSPSREGTVECPEVPAPRRAEEVLRRVAPSVEGFAQAPFHVLPLALEV